MSDHSIQEPAADVRGLSFIARAFSLIACLILFGMMVITFADVIGRYVFARPLPAAYEIISLMMPAVIFCALPLTVLREGHVTIDLLDGVTPRVLVPLRSVVVHLVSAVALGLVAWRLAIRAEDQHTYEDVSDQLWLPLWPFSTAMSILCAIATVCALALAVQGLRTLFRPS